MEGSRRHSLAYGSLSRLSGDRASLSVRPAGKPAKNPVLFDRMTKKTHAERRQRMSELESMLHQSNISVKNLRRLTQLSRHPDVRVARLASFVLEVGRVAPLKLSRWLEISSHHPTLFEVATAVLGQEQFQALCALDGHSWNPAQPPVTSVNGPQGPLPTPATPANDKPRPHVEIYTDGGCDPNPGPGGYAVVLVHPRKRAETSGAFRLTTNNRMEILAAIKGLEMLKRPCTVTVYSDSQYLVKAMSQGWAARWKRNAWQLSTKQPAKNVDLWDRLLALCAIHSVHFRWIKGHAGNRENERCDLLCAAAQQQKNLPPDLGYTVRHSRQPLPLWTASGSRC
jgi:ribonuclease HI